MSELRRPRSTEHARYLHIAQPDIPDKYTYWRRSILLGIILSAYLGYTKGGAYGWVPALVTFYSTVHIFESIAKKPEGIFARLFLVVTNLQRIIDFEDFILSPFRSQVKAA